MSEGSGTLAVIVFFVGVAIYFLPSINASSRKHPNSTSIFLLNLFLGWTLLGWVAALVWSASSVMQPIAQTTELKASAEEDKYSKLEKLGALKEKGLVSEDEYQTEKKKILQS